MNPSVLPEGIRTALLRVHRRTVRAAVVQGVCRLVLLLAIAAFAAILADACLGFPGSVRALFLSVWLGIASLEIHRRILAPLRQPPDFAALARSTEAAWPRMDERLSTVVSLAGDTGHGSPELIDELLRDTELRAVRLDPVRTVPMKPALTFAGLTILTFAFLLIPSMLVPRSGEYSRRFFTPWNNAKADPGWTLAVATGDVNVRRGDAVTLSAFVETTRDRAVLPTNAVLLVRRNGQVESQPMTRDNLVVFHARRANVTEDFEYAIAAGDAVTDWHAARAIDPPALADFRATILLPNYARTVGQEAATVEGLRDLSVLVHSRLSLDYRFDPLPETAFLEWTALGENPVVKKLPLPVVSKGFSLPVGESGTLRVILEGPKGIRSDYPPRTVAAIADAPPEFRTVTGFSARTRAIRPGEPMRIRAEVRDDRRVETVEVEYRTATLPARKIALTLERPPGGGAIASGTVDPVALAGGGAEVQLRLIASDNRRIPELGLAPQQTHYPADEKWATIRLEADAPPLAEQEIALRRDGIDEQLRRQIDELVRLAKVAERLKAAAAAKQAWTSRQTGELGDLRQRLTDSIVALESLARDTSLTVELAGLAEKIGGVVGGELAEADRRLMRVEADGERSRLLEAAENKLIEAVRKLEELRKENDRLAGVRRDLVRLDSLGNRQEANAEAAASPMPSPAKLAELLAEQKRLAEELLRLQQDSPTLKTAAQQQTVARAGELADAGEALARQIRELDQAMTRTGSERLRRRLEAMLRQQQELAERLARFERDTEILARAIQSKPLQTKEATGATADLTQNRTEDALLKMARVEHDLARLAGDLERAAANARDTKEALRQLARLQEELRHAAAELHQSPTADTPAAREALAAEQNAVARAVAALGIPPEDRLERLRKEFAGHHDTAVGAIASNRLERAEEGMNLARAALDRLSDLLPDRAARLVKTRSELNKLRFQQEGIRGSTDAILKPFQVKDPEILPPEVVARVAEVARKQRTLADELAALDLPGHEEREVRLRRAAREALDDLAAGRAGEIAQSQSRLKRELDRLDAAIGGGKPADEEVDRLAKKQREIADRLAALPKGKEIDKGLKRELSESQASIAAALPPLPGVPESSQLHHEAGEALKLADGRLRGLPTVADAARDTGTAAEALEKLSRAVNARDTPAVKAARLKAKQAEIADDYDILSRKPDPRKGEELRRAQERLAEELKGVRAGEFFKEKRKALDSVAKTRDITTGDIQAKNRKAAAESVRDLADKLAAALPADAPTAKAEETATAKTAKRARELAAEQQSLREEMTRAVEELRKPIEPTGAPKSDVAELARKQRAIAEELVGMALRLHGTQSPESTQANEAATAAGQAGRQLADGELAPASEAAQLTARRLRELAEGRAPMPTREAAAKLKARQDEIVRTLAEMSPAEAARNARAAQQQRQADLRRQTEDLGNDLARLREKAGENTALADEMKRTSAQVKQAADNLGKASMRQGDGDEPGASQARQQAADGLEMANRSLKATAPMPMSPSDSSREAGRSLAGAMEKMEAATNRLPSDPAAASTAMSESAKNLRSASKRLGQPDDASQSANAPMGPMGQSPTGTRPGTGVTDGSQTGTPDLRILGPDAAKYAGKSWGELPGELKTKLLQDLKERYGEDYARSIRLYFEQLASRRE